jgi:molecular chaperone GrpE
MKKEKDTNEDIEFIPEDGEDLKVADPIKKIKDLKEKLKACQEEKQDYLTNWQKERADFLNYKKEESARSEKMAKYSREEFAGELLPVIDSYDMAFANREAWEKVDKNWRMGVEYIHAQLLKVLADFGVEEIAVKEGDRFDHSAHQPVESVQTDDESKDQTVAKVLNKGYKTKDGILRPARVNVFAFK